LQPVDFSGVPKSPKLSLILGIGAVPEKRTIFRKRVLKTAQIVLSDKAPKLDCAVRNLSTTGACLQVSTTYGLPMSFDVVIEGTRHQCRAVWRTDTNIGVMFV
jgi:PilZ domain-containing protein